MELTYRGVDVNGVELFVASTNNEDGKPLLLLHGFPDYWATWEGLIDSFVEAGYRLIMPDMRGFHFSSKPKGMEKYNLDILTKDMVELMNYFDYEQFSVVGHDWGGIVAWQLATDFSKQIKKLVVLGVPHADTLREFSFRLFPQYVKSWYAIAFQVPWLTEIIMYPIIIRWVAWRYRKIRSNDYVEQMSGRGSARAAIKYYRAGLRRLMNGKPKIKKKSIKPKTLLLWAEKDLALTKKIGKDSIEFCQNGTFKTIKGSSHWMHWDKPKVVSKQIIKFLDDSKRKH